MTEKEKMISGNIYAPLDNELTILRNECHRKTMDYNNIDPKNENERQKAIKDIIKTKQKAIVESPFFCDYGFNISVGENFFSNFNCTFLDVCPIEIGDNVLIAPNVQLYTATHPLEADLRLAGIEYGKPIKIGNNVWIGGGAIVCPGVTIGDNAVVGAGCVVTKDIPENCLVVGNPARVVKTFNK